ncbi:glycosyltransferase family 2 protein [Roseococcus sp. SYP-B2431]|uniref:glycosyltransferase family 2 protein n=1 Tax=Roseococcus sp. SYP-B2431 TaxID=2496640 RepID=UPI00103BCAF3|nr:glycosyltransferase family 2 protein [Roseococcus sp. SYP-B2431]TCH96749.1 glycosyltransferase family 2 protein [Roseococcus sp. SYP-B2431]
MSAFLRPPFAQSLSFAPRAMAQSQSANYHQGEDIRLHVVIRGVQGEPHLIVNDFLDGQWGEELLFPLSATEAQAPSVGVAFAADGILVTPPGGAPAPFRPARPVPASVVLRLGPDIALGESGVPALPAAPPVPEGDGTFDACGPLPGTGHRLLVLRLADATPEAALTAAPVPLRLGGSGASPVSLLAFDAGEGQLGLIAAVPESEMEATGVEILPPGLPPLRFSPPAGSRIAPRPLPEDLLARLRRHLAEARGAGKPELERLLQRAFTGRSTAGWLSSPVRIQVARVVPTEAGTLLQGSFSDPHQAVAALRLRHGDARFDLAWIDVPANDGQGFTARAPASAWTGEAWLEVELHSGETGTLSLPAPSWGLPALRGLLEGIGAIPAERLDQAFDAVLGAPLVALNRARLAQPMAVEERVFGAMPDAPRASLVIPLHGRLDLLTAQAALLSDLPGDEVILVLDDPPRREAAVPLVAALSRRFGLAARLLLPAEQRGFGPASNLGLERARGRVVVFLNADAFPESPGWLDRLVAALDDPSIGAAGARLLYPDGSLQHGGMVPEAAADRAGWVFPEHPGKGLRPPAAAPAPRDVPALTGACLAMRREVARRYGGFDPAYVIGDFEDADLCAKLARDGLRRVMADTAEVTHLERQSQGRFAAGQGRWNLTLLNAWTYNRRWHGG